VLSLRQVESSATSAVDTKLQHALVIGTALRPLCSSFSRSNLRILL
jgi:hypothetical protein